MPSSEESQPNPHLLPHQPLPCTKCDLPVLLTHMTVSCEAIEYKCLVHMDMGSRLDLAVMLSSCQLTFVNLNFLSHQMCIKDYPHVIVCYEDLPFYPFFLGICPLQLYVSSLLNGELLKGRRVSHLPGALDIWELLSGAFKGQRDSTQPNRWHRDRLTAGWGLQSCARPDQELYNLEL